MGICKSVKVGVSKLSKEKKEGLGHSIWEGIKVVASAFVIALIINNFLLVNASVPTGSMETTVMAGDRVLFNRLSYLKDPPQRYDIIIFNFPYSQGNKPEKYVKRVIGLPGETVEIIDGKVYINGDTQALRDDFIYDTPNGEFGPYEVPEDSYFVLGDNRDDSYDSRYWPGPFISEDTILGKALLIYYPRIEVVKHLE